MEATSAKLRPLSVFQFGLGWSLGMACCVLLSNWTRNYKLTLAIALAWQLLLAVWSHLTIFESIRWLLDEGRLTRAQVELQRVCRINGVQNGAKLAAKIAQIQLEQVQQETPDLILDNSQPVVVDLSRQETNLPQQVSSRKEAIREIIWRNMKPEDQSSATAQGLVHLALDQSCQYQPRKQAKRQLESSNFVAKLFHPDYYKLSISLVLVNIMTEVGYYGLVQTHSIVGLNVDVNYLSGTASEWAADLTYLLVLFYLSRRFALLLPGLLAVFVLLGIVVNHQLLPLSTSSDSMLLTGHNQNNHSSTTSTILPDNIQVDSRISVAFVKLTGNNLQIYKLRELINFWLITVGKLAISVTSLVATTVAAEVFPSNLRQTAVGAMVFGARICSILSPFLFQDLSLNKHQMQATLLVTSSLGLFGIVLSFWHVKNMKHKDLAETQTSKH